MDIYGFKYHLFTTVSSHVILTRDVKRYITLRMYVIGLLIVTMYCSPASVIGADDIGQPTADVFVRNYLERGDTSSIPQPGSEKRVIHVFAARGEYEPATFSIRARCELKTVKVSLLHDLKSRTGESISADFVDIRLVDPLPGWTKRSYECFLLEETTLDIPVDTTRRFWVTVHVPADAQPGVYQSDIVIMARTSENDQSSGHLIRVGSVPYKVTVRPTRLLNAQQTGMAYFMYHNSGYFPGETVTTAYQTKVFEDMREHGMTTATIMHLGMDKDKFSLIETGRREDGVSASTLSIVQTMEILESTGLVAEGMPVIWVGAEWYGPEQWSRLLEEGQKRNWPEILFYAVDEPGIDEKYENRIVKFMDAMKSFHTSQSRFRVRTTTAFGSMVPTMKFGHYYDVWIGCMARYEGQTLSNLIDAARRQGKQLWTYDCALAPVDAETDRYYFGILAWVSGIKGCAHWATYDGGPALSYIYPGKDGPIPSIGWEAIREGIDDYRYLATLRRLADKAVAADKEVVAKGAERLFAQLKALIDVDRYSEAYLEGRKAEDVNCGRRFERPRVQPELAVDLYDRIRQDAADEIERISRDLDWNDGDFIE